MFFRSPLYHRSNDDDKSRKRKPHLSSSTSKESPSKRKNSAAGSSGINPVTGRPLWRWEDGDDGYRRPGSKGKSAKKKVFHRDIQRGPDEVLSVGDCAVFLSAARVDRPYVRPCIYANDQGEKPEFNLRVRFLNSVAIYSRSAK